MSFISSDYHDFTYPEMPKELRLKLNIGPLYINGAVCKSCGYFIRSKNRHDLVTCKCGDVSIDGGSYYQKVSHKEGAEYELITMKFKGEE